MPGKVASVVEEPSVTRPVALQRGGPVESGETTYAFDPPETLELFVTSASAEDREQLVTGTDETASYKVAAMPARNVTEGDRLWFDDGRPVRATVGGVPSGMNPYRVGVPQMAPMMDGETFAWLPLTEDARGDASGSDSTDESGSGSGSGSSGDNDSDVWVG